MEMTAATLLAPLVSSRAGARLVSSDWLSQLIIASDWSGEDESEPGDSFGQPWRLRQTSLPLVSDADCHQIYLEGAGFTIQDTMQCAGENVIPSLPFSSLLSAVMMY